MSDAQRSWRRWLRPALGLLITGAFVWLLLTKVDVVQVAVALRRISWLSVGTALVCLAAGYAARIVRWWWMLRAAEPGTRLRACAWPFIASTAVNNLLPFRAGDALRAFGFTRELHAAPAIRLGTVLIERFLDLMVVLLFFFVGALGVSGAAIPQSYVNTVAWLSGAGVLGWLLAVAFRAQLARALLRMCHHRSLVARGWSARLERQARQFMSALAPLGNLRLTTQLIGMSLLVWLWEGAVFAVVAHSLTPTVPPLGAWFALALGALATLIPSSPGYIGTFDFFAMNGLIAYGADRSAAAAFAIAVHALLWLPLTLAGIAYFLTRAAPARQGNPEKPLAARHEAT